MRGVRPNKYVVANTYVRALERKHGIAVPETEEKAPEKKIEEAKPEPVTEKPVEKKVAEEIYERTTNKTFKKFGIREPDPGVVLKILRKYKQTDDRTELRQDLKKILYYDPEKIEALCHESTPKEAILKAIRNYLLLLY